MTMLDTDRVAEFAPIARPSLHDEVTNRVRDMIVDGTLAPGADADSVRYAQAAASGASLQSLSQTDQERLGRINQILDEQVRPYLQGDGGDLYVMGLEGNRLMVHYQGACGSCPSSISGTLTGIESLVRQIEPDMEVVAV